MRDETPNFRILVVDDEPEYLSALKRQMSRSSFFRDKAVEYHSRSTEALQRIQKSFFHFLITDLHMPELDGRELLNRFLDRYPKGKVIVISADSQVREAVGMIRKGAVDYLSKPFEMVELEEVVRRIIQDSELLEKVERLEAQLDDQHRNHRIIFRSAVMDRLMRQLTQIKDTPLPVLILGESGTGKELVADFLHHRSVRRDGPFIKVNCAALSPQLLESEMFGHVKGAFTGAENHRKGKFELADNGTLFLDEIAEMAPELQAKLLRVLQDGSFERLGDSRPRTCDVHVIAATNRDLKKMVADGSFRQDLFFRLETLTLEVPPLRNRRDDIALLIVHFLEKYKNVRNTPLDGFTEEALAALQDHNFPGNIRELENIVARCVTLAPGPQISLQDLPSLSSVEIPSAPHKEFPEEQDERMLTHTLKSYLEAAEKRFLEAVLKKYDNNRSRAADSLGISRRQLYNRLAYFQIGKRLQ